MSIRQYVPLLFVFLLLGSCQSTEPQTPVRAHSPWAFRSVLDGKARMLTLALHDDLWVAYSAETGSLYKAWRGGVNFDGAVYTTVHGPQPSSLGDSWVENAYDVPWKVISNGKEETPGIQFRGHRFIDDQVWVNYELILGNGSRFTISERPEYVTNEFGQTGLERTFRTSEVPANTEVILSANYQSLPTPNNISTDGEWTITSLEERQAYRLSAVDLDGSLKLNSNDDTQLTAFFTHKPLLPNENKVVGAEEEERRPLGYRLISRSDCRTCHNTYLQTVGPSYADIATRYPNTDENVEMLVNKVQQGGAGVWGEAAMTPHPDLSATSVRAMVQYIMSLDEEQESKLAAIQTDVGISEADAMAAAEVNADDFLPGAIVRAYDIPNGVNSLDQISFTDNLRFEGILPEIELFANDFGELEEHFALEVTGYLRIPKTSNYTFRLTSDDGSRMFINDQLIIDNDGLHGDEAIDGEVTLAEGYHPVRIVYFQGSGGRVFTLKWRSFDSEKLEVVSSSILMHRRQDQPTEASAALSKDSTIPGDGTPVESVHPSYTLSQARPSGFSPKVGGMDFLSDGRIVISTWDAEGGIYIVDGVQSGDPSQMSYQKIATGLAEPLGVKVVDDRIYILQKQELTELIDHDEDGMIDEFRTVSNDWQVSANFHEFAFGLAYQEPYFYAALAIAILPGGASANPQIPDRGKAVRIHRETGELEIVAEGLRTPNGVGIGVDNEVFIADNQGDWLPSSKILHVTEGDFFGSRAVDSARVAQLPVKLPVVWLPQDEIGNSPTTPAWLNDGPYAGQMVHGEVTHGGVKRVFVEKVNGEYQGCVFRFIQGLEAGVNRLVWGPDTALYVGGIGSTGNWQHSGRQWYGLQRLKYNGASTFEMLAVRARSNGIEIEFTEPLAVGLGSDAAEYMIQQWYYLPTHEYGGPKLDERRLSVQSVHMSDDRKKVFLELSGMEANHVVYVRLPSYWTSGNDQALWTTEAWYTMNYIPENLPGFDNPAPAPPPANTLTDAERSAGWTLLFDGQTTNGWHKYGNAVLGNSWQVEDGALLLRADRQPDGSRRVMDGGDIVTEGEYENFDLRLEWKIAPCGNSGIFFHVVESDDYDYAFLTGPEMQILDNTCHPDAAYQTHRAGSLFDMISATPETARPSGEWNRVRILVQDGELEFWLNGRPIVQTELFSSEWDRLVANSKFHDWAGFGKARSGYIALQDHGDQVWFRNMKIREL